jgi:hypothetical protein
MGKFAAVTLGVLGALGILAAGLSVTTGDFLRAHPAPAAPRPVLVELFTSEGCSSCPAADRLLTHLVETQPIAGARVIALGEHVDYWDRLGWRDPYSSATFSRRQAQYQTWVFASSTVYTPQLVIDGVRQEVGSARFAVKRAVAQAAWLAKGTMSIETEAPANWRVPVVVNVSQLPHGSTLADLYIAITQDGLTTSVASGENGGRTLSHTAVVRSLAMIEPVPRDQTAFTTASELSLSPAWHIDRLHVVAFVQERGTRRVLAAGDHQVATPP